MTDSKITPEGAFAQLGNETRITIIRILGEARGEALAFSELHERVGTHDSGQFNYHLSRLIGLFVRRTEGGKYELTYAGNRVIGSIYSGEFNQSTSEMAFRLESDCDACSIPLRATYAQERVTIQCSECDEPDTRFGFPPGAIENRSPAELTCVFDRWLKSTFTLIYDGVCTNCWGKLEATLTDVSEFLHAGDQVNIEYQCERCADESAISISSYLYLHPEVVRFYHKHNIDIRRIALWNTHAYIKPVVRVISEDPWQIETIIDIEGDQLTININQGSLISDV